MVVNTSAVDACADDDLAKAFLSAQAKVANVSESAVEVQCVAGGDSTSRRLAESITWSYKITVESEEQASGVVSLIEDRSEAELADEIKDFLPENSQYKTVAVTGITAAASVVTVTSTTTLTHEHGGPGGDEGLDDSRAHTPAALGAVAVAMFTATLTLSH